MPRGNLRKKLLNPILERLPQLHTEIRRLKIKNLKLLERVERRPQLDHIIYHQQTPTISIPTSERTYDECYWMAQTNPVLRRCINALRERVFRKPLMWEPKFQAKCTECGQEYKHKPEKNICDNEIDGQPCGGKLREPEEEEKQKTEEFFNAVNANKQKLTEVLKQLEDDINISDDSWLILRKEYDLHPETGAILESRLVELIRGSPRHMRFIHNDEGVLGGNERVCLNHRQTPLGADTTECPICGDSTHPIWYVSTTMGVGSRGSPTPRTYYIEGEVIHNSKYCPSLLHGYSPIAVLWTTAETYRMMLAYMYTAYDKKRLPSGIVMVKHRNRQQVMDQWRAEMEELQRDPNHIPLIVVDPETREGGVEFVKFTDTIREMDYREIRNELKMEIGLVYGVEPMFLNDMSTGGGLNNEGLQITVTNGAVESSQEIYNEHILPKILESCGVKDWTVKLEPPEEKDEMAEKQVRAQEVQNALGMRALGFDVDLDDDEEFKYTKSTNIPPEEGDVPGEASLPNLLNPNLNQAANRPRGEPENMRRMETTQKKNYEDISPDRIQKTLWDNALKAIRLGALWENIRTVGSSDKEFIIKLLKTAFTRGAKAYDEISLIKQIVSKTGLSEGESERIVRTERQAVINKARELFWTEKEGSEDYLYKWVGPSDNRTTDICKRIMSRTSQGVKIGDIKRIIREEADPKTYHPERPFSPHIQCRHRMVRMVV